LKDSNDDITATETTVVIQPSEAEPKSEEINPDEKARSPVEELTNQEDEQATLASAEMKDSVEVEADHDRKANELDLTGKGLEESEESESSNGEKELADEPKVNEDLSTSEVSDKADETEVHVGKETEETDVGLELQKSPSVQKMKERYESSLKHVVGEDSNSTDKADLGTGEEIAKLGSTNRGSPVSDQASDAALREPLKDSISINEAPLTADSKESGNSEDIDESEKDTNQPETESGADIASETVTKESKSEAALHSGGNDEHSYVLEV
jgi:hypothetical protein